MNEVIKLDRKYSIDYKINTEREAVGNPTEKGA